MWTKCDIVVVQEILFYLRLPLENVKSRSFNLAGVECMDEGSFIDDGPTACINDEYTFLALGQS